jgi:nucleotide-binding universal stress UspA family protein
MTIFPTKILLATDGSKEAELALRTAVDLTSSTSSELHVVTVGHEYRPPYDISKYDHLLEEDLREATLRRLEREA